MIKVIIFDAFGTLIKVESGASASLVMERIPDPKPDTEKFRTDWKKFYRDNTRDDIPFKSERRIFGERIKMFYEIYGVDRDPEADNRLTMESFKDRVLYPEVLENIRELRKKYRVVIASNTDDDILDAIMSKQGLQVDGVFTSESIGYYKPSPLFYRAVLKALGVEAAECVFAGASIVDDVSGPKAMGMKTLFIDRSGGAEKPSTADMMLSSIPAKLDL